MSGKSKNDGKTGAEVTTQPDQAIFQRKEEVF